jgi:hypothetical protein
LDYKIKSKLLIDPESGWKYGFPKEAPEEFYTLNDDFDMQSWLEDNGYPLGKIPYYIRYIESRND